MDDSQALDFFDAFMERLRYSNGDVAAWIELASPVTSGVSAQLIQLDELRAWLDGFRPLPSAVVEELRHFYTVQLTFHSNSLEGNTLSKSETELVLSHGVTIGGHSLVEHLEVIGHRDAMVYMEELSHEESPIGEREIKDLHALIIHPIEGVAGGSEAGKFRSLDVRAAGTNHLYPPHYLVRDLMDEFTSWLGSHEARALHPVVYATEAHFRLVSIHPFRDGNGRTARLLMNLCLLRASFPIAIINNTWRAQYLEALVQGQGTKSHEAPLGDAIPLAELVALACRESFVETLRLLATAPSSRGHSAEFYRALLSVVPQLPN